MLTSLLNKLKSEKSIQQVNQSFNSFSAVSSVNQLSETDCERLYAQLQSYHFQWKALIQEQCNLPTHFTRIRYHVFSELPNIVPLVRNCKFSTFHNLKFSQRKVKEIILKRENQEKEYHFDNMEVYPLPKYLQFLEPALDSIVPTYNHILINDYPEGIGIMPHKDGPSYFGRVFVLSFGSYCVIQFTNPPQEEREPQCHSVLLEPKSVHIFQEQAYTNYLHGIQNKEVDTVYLSYDNETKKVVRSSILNFDRLELKAEILQSISKMQETDIQQIELRKGNVRVLKFRQQLEYNYQLKIIRKPRISITIREKYYDYCQQ